MVVDKGPSPNVVDLNVYIDGNLMTCAKGDGIIISTPTGSTAYNMSAGGSIMQTHAKNILLAPLAPHSLSFRHLVLTPESSITLEKVSNARGPAWVALDGANRFRIEDGESIVISGSHYPLPMVTLKADNLTDLWA